MTTIITKNGSGAPTSGQLSQGELAVDLTNKELYTKDSGGNVIKVGAQGGSTGTFTDLTATASFTSPGIDDNATSTQITVTDTDVDFSGNIDVTGTATLPDANVTTLDVTGTSTLANADVTTLTASGLTYPASDGSNGQAIVTDGSGTLAFGDILVFPSGTSMLFAQTTAPTGWTKSTTHDDKALRVVSGTAGSGGSVAFTTAFGLQNVSATTLSVSQMPSHNHSQYLSNYTAAQVNTAARQPRQLAYQFTGYTNSTGGGGSHTHSVDLSVNYVDVIIATKD